MKIDRSRLISAVEVAINHELVQSVLDMTLLEDIDPVLIEVEARTIFKFYPFFNFFKDN